MATFVLEIGFEELPARFLASLEEQAAGAMRAALEERHLAFEDLAVAVTPRRAAVTVTGLADVQPVREEEVLGPPARIAYGPDGAPTKAATGFAAGQGVDVGALYPVQTEKGEYLAATVRTGGNAASDVLAELCPDLILGLSFPKRMHWGAYDTLFARPLRWVLALLDDAVVPFSVGPLESGRVTYGHRVHGPGPFEIAAATAYASVIGEQGHITLHGADRRATIIDRGNALALDAGGRVLWKDSLLDEVQGLAEHPVPLLGAIDPAYLELPREVLLTSMESHQKSFGLEGPDGALMPYFLTVLNMTPPDADLVRRGWERVLRARLEDARFFWKSDLAANFDDWRASLDKVTFLAPLGSMGDKTRRLAQLCRWLSQAVADTEGEKTDPEQAARAGLLSKADLVSGMVGEFDTLQGIMGGIYAAKKGEPAAVSAALAEQYLPAGPDTPIPASMTGAIVSMADKADTLAGCFGLGMIPTGAADPYALRRCALGIARIMLEKGLRFDVAALFEQAVELYGDRNWKVQPPENLAKLCEFFSARVRNMFLGQGEDTLLVEAVTNVDALDVWAAARRLDALRAMSRSADFDQSVQTFKRVANIIRKQAEGASMPDGNWVAGLFTEQAERELADAVSDFNSRFAALEREHDYPALFGLLAGMRPAVDAFFEGVMVMAEDPAVRANRLNLLAALLKPLSQLADFAALQR